MVTRAKLQEQYESRVKTLDETRKDLEQPGRIQPLVQDDVAEDAYGVGLICALLGRHEEARSAFREATFYWQRCQYYEQHLPNYHYLDQEHKWMTVAVLTGDRTLANEVAATIRGERVKYRPCEGHWALAMKYLLVGDGVQAKTKAEATIAAATQQKSRYYEALGLATVAVAGSDHHVAPVALANAVAHYPRSGHVRGTILAWACLEGAALVQVARWLGMDLAADHHLLVPGYLDTLREDSRTPGAGE